MTAATKNPATSQDTTTKLSFLKGFFNFDTFIIPRLLKVVYIIGFILIPLYTIGGGVVTALYALYYWYNSTSTYAPSLSIRSKAAFGQ